MLLWSRSGRAAAVAVFAVLLVVVVIAPFAMLALAAVAGSWTGALPNGLTAAHLAEALDADGSASLLVSVQTALLAGAVSLLIGTWAALAAQDSPGPGRRLILGL